MIGQRLQASLILTGTGIVMAIIIGVPLGIISAYKPYSKWDSLANFIAFLGSSVPNFFLSLILIYVISVKLGWLPTSGMYSTSGNREFGDLVQHLILPAIVCGIQPIGNYIKQTRASVMEVLNEEYIKTARSKGLQGPEGKHHRCQTRVPQRADSGCYLDQPFHPVPDWRRGRHRADLCMAWHRQPDGNRHQQPRLPGHHGRHRPDLGRRSGCKPDSGPDLRETGSAYQLRLKEVREW